MSAFNTNEMMTVAAARRLGNGTVCFVGIGLPSKACLLYTSFLLREVRRQRLGASGAVVARMKSGGSPRTSPGLHPGYGRTI